MIENDEKPRNLFHEYTRVSNRSSVVAQNLGTPTIAFSSY